MIKQSLLALPALCLFTMSGMAEGKKIKGDPAYGEYLSAECVTCHQISGKYDGIPPIVGWEPQRFWDVMREYQKKERDNKVMQTIAKSLDDEQLAALAVYFASIKPKE